MKLVMTLLVRDEADVVRANLEFHLARGVDFVIATDNRSEDGATDVLREYERRGVLRYFFEPADDYAQSAWVTRMARLAATDHGADWVINSDVDEFWYPESGDLKACLSTIPSGVDAVAVQRFNFVPREMEPGDRFHDVMTVRETSSRNVEGNPLPPKICHRAHPDIDVAMGNHAVSRDGARIEGVSSSISLLHFPMRTYAAFMNKIAKGGAALARNSALGPGVGYTWRTYLRMLGEGRLKDHFDGMILDAADIARGISAGELVIDTRLRDAFAALDPLGDR